MEKPSFLRLVGSEDPKPERLPQQEVFDPVKVLEQATHIRKYINGLLGHISNNAMAESEQIVQGYTVQELQSLIMGSSENDWRVKPVFYTALCDRYYLLLKEKK